MLKTGMLVATLIKVAIENQKLNSSNGLRSMFSIVSFICKYANSTTNICAGIKV